MRNDFCGSSGVSNDYLDILSSISNDVMINNLVDDLINRDGVTNFFCDNNKYIFKNEKGEYVYIFISSNDIYIENNFDGIIQHIIYKINSGGKYILINNFSSIKSHDNCIDRTVKFEKMYDCYDNMIFENKIVEMKESNGDNSCSIISKYVVDGVYVRINSVSYDNNHDMDRVDYYVFLKSSWVNIGIDEFNQRFVEKINEKVLQKEKSMV